MNLEREQQVAAGSQPAIETPDVPSREETQANPALLLAWIQSRIHNIYSVTKDLEPDSQSITISTSAYAKLYSAVVNYCIVTKAGPHRGNLKQGDLYLSMEREIRAYCSGIRYAIFTNKTQDLDIDAAERLLQTYVVQWDRFVKLARLVKNLLRFLERHWIRREIVEKKKDRYMIEDLHKRAWKEETLQIKKDGPSSRELQALTDAAVMLREKAGGFTVKETDLVQSVVNALSSIDLTFDAHLDTT